MLSDVLSDRDGDIEQEVADNVEDESSLLCGGPLLEKLDLGCVCDCVARLLCFELLFLLVGTFLCTC